jgi:hypothetical protein
VNNNWYSTSVFQSGSSTDLVVGSSFVNVTVNGSPDTGNNGVWLYQEGEDPAVVGTPLARRSLTSTETGSATFSLGEGRYFFGYRYNGVLYYSPVVSLPAITEISVNLTQVRLLDVLGSPLQDIRGVWFYQDGEDPAVVGAPLDRRSLTNSSTGIASFNLPSGDYFFRTNVNNNWYSTSVFQSGSSTDLVVGSSFVNVTVNGSPDTGNNGVWFYQEGEDPAVVGTPLARRSLTSTETGSATFSLGEGRYFFGYLYNGVSYYSQSVRLPSVIELNVNTIKIYVVDGGGAPLPGVIRVWFWLEGEDPDEVGPLLSRRSIVDEDRGFAEFNLAAGNYVFGHYANGRWYRTSLVPSQRDTYLFVD